jgi:hypothetical protein
MTCGVQITGQMMRICCLCYWILFLVSGITVVGAKPTSAQSNTHRHHAANNKAFKGLLFLPHLFDSFPSFFPCVWLCHRIFYDTSIFFRNRSSNKSIAHFLAIMCGCKCDIRVEVTYVHIWILPIVWYRWLQRSPGYTKHEATRGDYQSNPSGYSILVHPE